VDYAPDGFAVTEPFELHQQPFLGPEPAHLMVQAQQVAHQDRDRFPADPAFADVWMERLISKAPADVRRSQIDPARALPWDQVSAEGSLTGDTACIAVVAAQGHAVCR
jgi:gamma-glutamyltranspeptidase/glutathione hydrolase